VHWNGTAWSQDTGAASAYPLYAIWEGAAGDVWTVGASGTIAHRSGGAWSTVSSLAAGDGQSVNAAWGSGPDDVWAVGVATILHWDGHAWTAAPPSTTGPAGSTVLDTLSLYGVWGSAANDVWAVGSSTIPTNAGWVLHYDGHAWSSASPTNTHLASVWGSGPKDVWAVGLVGGGSTGGIVHYDGTAWQDVALQDASTVSDLHAVWGSSPTNVWAVGTTILHFDGSIWSAAPGATGGALSGLWGSSQRDVWAAGGANILHFDGTMWSTSNTGVDAGAYSLNRVWGSGADDVWAVGSLVTGPAPVGGPGAVLHWTGAGWSACALATTSLYGVWGSGPTDVWALGGRNSILHGP
jgi:hypothetical protein